MDDATAPRLPWHYLGAIACLAKGETVVETSGNETARNLINELYALPGADLAAAFDATQDANASGSLFSYVRDIGTAAGKKSPDGTPKYAWPKDWPTNVSIRVGTGSTPDLFLSPTALVVSLPLEGDVGHPLYNRTVAARQSAGKPSRLPTPTIRLDCGSAPSCAPPTTP